jgi:flagellar basal-body rod protein FlgB
MFSINSSCFPSAEPQRTLLADKFVPHAKLLAAHRAGNLKQDQGLRMAPGLHDSRRMLDQLASRIERYMDLLSARQRLVAGNLANADTPGYKTQDIDFSSELRSAAARLAPQVHEVHGLAVKSDGNNVSLDREARLLAENALRFNVASNLLRSQIRVMRSAIQEGRSA